MFAWPKLLVPALTAPEQILPDAQKYLRKLIEKDSTVLSAYKGDKHVPELGPSPAGPPARATA